MSKKKATLTDELKAFRKEHATIDEDGKAAPMTWEALGQVSPVAMLTLYRIGTGRVKNPLQSTCTIVRGFMARHKCRASACCRNCDKRRSRKRAL